jgi:pimeloyl-ACP methyl ester carboxylesterase
MEQKGQLNVDGVKIYGEWRRPKVAGKPALVFLHDGLGTVETLRQLPEMVADRLGLPAFVYDRLGYGRSDDGFPWPTFFMEEAAKLLPKVLDAAGIADCVLVGHSDGGSVTLLYAGTAPARVRAAVTISAHICIDAKTEEQMIRHRKMVADNDIPGYMTRFHGARGPDVLRAWTGALAHPDYARWDLRPAIRGIRAPLLALQGANDEFGLPSQLDGIKQAVPHAEIELMTGLAHFPQIEAPDRIADRVAGFIAQCINRV